MYQQTIKEILAAQGCVGKYDPRHIEAYMRLEHSTLDGLSLSKFKREVTLCAQCVDEGGRDAAERNARSFGL
jgi:hypothetical protein